MVNQSQNSLRVECVNTSKHGINITRTRTRDKRLHFSNKIIKMSPEGISGVVLVIFFTTLMPNGLLSQARKA